jgi:ABC-2 type transport system permease protein
MTALLERPPAHRALPHHGDLTGTIGLLRVYARRDRIALPLWVLLLSVPVSTVYVGSTDAVYPTAADRAGLAASIMASPAQRALYGRVFDDSVGAIGVWKAGIFGALIAVAAILTVIRHTRADEEDGRSELLDATAVGRHAGLAAAVLLSGGACVATGVLATAGLLTLDIPAAGSVAFGIALAGAGLVFTGVAAVCAQVSSSARFCRGTAFGVLAVAFLVRAVGDAAPGAQWLTWLSPLGWSLQVRPYAGDRFWVSGLHVALTVGLIGLAVALRDRRDVGAGLVADRRGPARAATGLRGVLALAWRLDRGSLAVWTAGLTVYGLVIGSIVAGVDDEIGDSTTARDVVARLGGTAAVEQAFLAVAFSMLGMIAAAAATSLTLRLHREEGNGHAETVLAGSVSRTRWLTGHLACALGGPAVALLIAGLVAALAYGASTGDPAGKLAPVLGTAAVQLPAVWLLAAVAVALFGAAPRLAPLAWGVLVAFIAVYLLGTLADAPQWLLDLEPFTHIPHVGDGAFTAAPLVWLLLIDAALIVFGGLAFRRRDLR